MDWLSPRRLRAPSGASTSLASAHTRRRLRSRTAASQLVLIARSRRVRRWRADPDQYLIDGDAIRQVRTREVTYYHLELPQHDVLLANGLATELYLSSEDRSDFANGGGPMKLHPDFAVRQWEAFACAPLVVTGPAIAAVRRRVGSIDLEHALNLDRRVSR